MKKNNNNANYLKIDNIKYDMSALLDYQNNQTEIEKINNKIISNYSLDINKLSEDYNNNLNQYIDENDKLSQSIINSEKHYSNEMKQTEIKNSLLIEKLISKLNKHKLIYENKISKLNKNMEVNKNDYMNVFKDERNEILAKKALIDKISETASSNYHKKYSEIIVVIKDKIDNHKREQAKMIKQLNKKLNNHFEKNQNQFDLFFTKLLSEYDALLDLTKQSNIGILNKIQSFISDESDYLNSVNSIIEQVYSNQAFTNSISANSLLSLTNNINDKTININGFYDLIENRLATDFLTKNYVNTYNDSHYMKLSKAVKKHFDLISVFSNKQKDLVDKQVQFFNNLFDKKLGLLHDYLISTKFQANYIENIIPLNSVSINNSSQTFEFIVTIFIDAYIEASNIQFEINNYLFNEINKIKNSYDEIDKLHRFNSFNEVFKSESLLDIKIKYFNKSVQNNHKVSMLQINDENSSIVLDLEYETQRETLMKDIKIIKLKLEALKTKHINELKKIDNQNKQEILALQYDHQSKIYDYNKNMQIENNNVLLEKNERIYQLEVFKKNSWNRFESDLSNLKQEQNESKHNINQKIEKLIVQKSIIEKNLLIDIDTLNYSNSKDRLTKILPIENQINTIESEMSLEIQQRDDELRKLEYAFDQQQAPLLAYLSQSELFKEKTSTRLIEINNDFQIILNRKDKYNQLIQIHDSLKALINESVDYQKYLSNVIVNYPTFKASALFTTTLKAFYNSVVELNDRQKVGDKLITKAVSSLEAVVDQLNNYNESISNLIKNEIIFLQQAKTNKEQDIIKVHERQINSYVETINKHKIQINNLNVISTNELNQAIEIKRNETNALIESITNHIENLKLDLLKIDMTYEERSKALNGNWQSFLINHDNLEKNLFDEFNQKVSDINNKYNAIFENMNKEFSIAIDKTNEIAEMNKLQLIKAYQLQFDELILENINNEKKVVSLDANIQIKKNNLIKTTSKQLEDLKHEIEIQTQEKELSFNIFDKQFEQELLKAKKEIQSIILSVEQSEEDLKLYLSDKVKQMRNIIETSIKERFIDVNQSIESLYKIQHFISLDTDPNNVEKEISETL